MSLRNLLDQPFSLPSPDDLNSPWSPSNNSPANYDDLTLPPINSNSNANNNYGQLPLPRFEWRGVGGSDQDSFSFDALLGPGPGLRAQEGYPSLPSNQQTRQPDRSAAADYRIGTESPDPFEDWSDLQNLDGISPVHSPRPQIATSRSRTTTRRSSFVDLTESSPPHNTSENMAPSRKRKAEDAGEGRASKITRAGSRAGSSPGTPKAKVEAVDLTDVENEEQYKELAAKQQAELIKKQQQDEATRPVRLADFNCIICMDNPTDLTVTHCGHLFCSECLHQALYAGDKKCCPVCRTPISTTMTGREKNKQPKNGIFALEMKLMTANKKGKRPIRA
ncbi:hypothetical protein B0J14DRAFT_634313 [Halenospora varia]|nr:hypothetical protein B0J14DRAFT_634313 [Halenospora varia]